MPRTKCFDSNPPAASGSCCFNPMEELRLGTEYEVGDVQNLALLLVDPNGRGIQSQDHWAKTAYSLLVGCILHLCYKARVEKTPATFGELDRILADSSRPIADLWNEMLSYSHVNGQDHPVVSASARDMIDRPASEAGSVLSTAKTFLDLYRDPTVAKNTSCSDFKIRDLMHNADPVSLYIVTQPNDKERLRPLVRIVVNMIVPLLADKMQFENGRPKPTYKHKLLAMIDEFPALGKLEILQQSLAFVAGYGIKCYLIAQDINQLKSRETGYGPDESITSNCHIQAAFPPNRLETAEHLSKLTGVTTIVKEQITRSGRGLGVQSSVTMQEVQRPLLTPDECLRMPGPKKDQNDMIMEAGDMVVYCAGFPAIYGRQPLYFEDETFYARAAVSPPKYSDSL
jgi:type IV secretion system protein VirD4